MCGATAAGADAERVRSSGTLQDRLSRGRVAVLLPRRGGPRGRLLGRALPGDRDQRQGRARPSPSSRSVYVPVTTEDRFQAVQDGRIDILCGATHGDARAARAGRLLAVHLRRRRERAAARRQPAGPEGPGRQEDRRARRHDHRAGAPQHPGPEPRSRPRWSPSRATTTA